jgi:hypothetical protein
MVGMSTRSAERTRKITPTTRKWLLLLHIVVSVGWLGLNVGNLTLAITGLTTDDAGTQHAAFKAMHLIGGTLLVPVSLLAFTSGLALSLLTRWGLFRHRWVLVKFTLTLIAVVLIPVSLLPGLRELSAMVDATAPDRLTDAGGVGLDLLAAGLVSTTMYLTNAVLSVMKPWGRTRTT